MSSWRESVTVQLDVGPYWKDTSYIRRFPRVEHALHTDVVVIGGGITGITTAYLLKQAGRRVAIVERGRCAGMDTGHTTAHLTCVTDTRLSDARRSRSARIHARAAWDAGLAAIAKIESDRPGRTDRVRLRLGAGLPARTGIRGTRSPRRRPSRRKPHSATSARLRRDVSRSRAVLRSSRHPVRRTGALRSAPVSGGAARADRSATAATSTSTPTADETVADRSARGRRRRSSHRRVTTSIVATHNPIVGNAGLVGRDAAADEARAVHELRRRRTRPVRTRFPTRCSGTPAIRITTCASIGGRTASTS